MFCDRCGNKIIEGQNFCPACGKTLQAQQPIPVAPQERRVANNIRLLGILWLAYAALHLLPGLFLIVLIHSVPSFFPPNIPPFVPGLVQGFGFGLSALSILGLIVGWGLLNWKEWARTLSLILGALSLLNFPFGTGLGIYTLWVLLPENSEQEYRQHALAGA